MPDPQSCLARAREHCFLAGVHDSGAALCEAAVPYGLAKLHLVQERLGYPPDAVFVGAPDATVTRNPGRWRQGIGYGGAYAWSGDLVPLDLKPNACGMLVGALPSLPDLAEVRGRADRLEREGLELDGIPIEFDLRESNHFCDLMVPAAPRVPPETTGAAGLVPCAPAYFILHSSGHEHRGPSPFGPGLYHDESEELRRLATVHETPWGRLSVLTGPRASEWLEFYRRVQEFNHRRREAFARALFGAFIPIANATHQGLVRPGRANLGCYTFEGDGTGQLFPLTLTPTLPAYLIAPRPSFSAAAIRALGWEERAARHGVTARLSSANLLPHGGGYTYPALDGVTRVHEDGPDARRFELRCADGSSRMVANARELPFAYRGLEVLRRLVELDLGAPVLELHPHAIV